MDRYDIGKKKPAKKKNIGMPKVNILDMTVQNAPNVEEYELKSIQRVKEYVKNVTGT